LRHLSLPAERASLSSLRAGDVVKVSGRLVTARDRAHRRALELSTAPVELKSVYHCGPLVRRAGDGWEVLSAGPTTSARMEAYLEGLLERFGTTVIIGKGGFSEAALDVLRRYGCVYLSFTGGAGALAAAAVKKVLEVHWLELGIPEALWVLEVRDFGPLVVAMDARGGSVYARPASGQE